MLDRFTSKADIQQAEQALAILDPRMAMLIEQHGPCQINAWQRDLFTALISSIVSQQLSTKAAQTIFGRVLALVNDSSDTLDATTLASQAPDKLRECGLSQAKARYVLGLSEATTSGELSFRDMHLRSDEEVINQLIAYAGVGRWTAEMFLIFALGSPDVVSYADLGLKRGMMRYLKMSEYPDQETFQTTAKIWQPYRSIASWYLWRLAD